jgi:hypothetical protein
MDAVGADHDICLDTSPVGERHHGTPVVLGERHAAMACAHHALWQARHQGCHQIWTVDAQHRVPGCAAERLQRKDGAVCCQRSLKLTRLDQRN